MNEKKLQAKLDSLPKEFRDALRNPIIVELIKSQIDESQRDLDNVFLICNNPEQYLKKVNPQINFIAPDSLIQATDPYIVNIRNDLNNYRKLYEKEVKEINSIINNAILSVKQIYPLTKNLQNNIKNYTENFSNSITNMNVPLLNKKIGISEIKYENYTKENKDSFIKERDIIFKKIDNFFEESNNYFDNFSQITLMNCQKIGKVIEDFLQFPKSVKELCEFMSNSKKSFERSCKKFNDFSNKDAINKAFEDIKKPLNELSQMEKTIQNIQLVSIKESMEKEEENIQDLKVKIDKIEESLKTKSDEISNEITELRKKYKENKVDFNKFETVGLVNIQTNDLVEGIINETKKINEQIKVINEKLNKDISTLIIQSRLDLLLIMDITNSMDSYLDQVKKQFFNILNRIRKECGGVEIHLGFVGFRDFGDLDFGEQYINLELTDKYDSILENIKYIEAQGGGDIPEDLCSALEFAKNKEWKGRSRITILVTDSPCHGKKYYDEVDETYDNFPEGDREGRNIEDYIKYLSENEISVFCLNINHSTDKMFKIFDDVFNKNKKKDSNNRFMVVSDNDIYNVVTTYAIETFQNRKLVEIKE